MTLELHVWGPAFGLPSIDAECTAAIAYINRIVPAQWILIADHDASISPRHEFPFLIDGDFQATGFADIVSYLRNHRPGAFDLDFRLTNNQQMDKTAFISLLQSTGGPLIDLSLYVSSENYNAATSSAYTAILPWYLNYTIPPARRELARTRTAHLGLSSLDVQAAEQDRSQPGGRSLASDFEAAKRDSGIPTQPKVLSMGRKAGISGMLGSPVYAARFKLDALSNELFEPLSALLGNKEFLLDGNKPSSLDCVAYGYLALMLYPEVPQAWLKEAMQARFPLLVNYVGRMREEFLGGEEVKAADVWSVSSRKKDNVEIEGTLQKLGLRLPWRPHAPQAIYLPIVTAIREMTSNLPLLQRRAVIQADAVEPSRRVSSSLPSTISLNIFFGFSAAVAAALVGMAIQHRRFPREGDLIFWALRPRAAGLGEAGSILGVLAAMPQGMY